MERVITLIFKNLNCPCIRNIKPVKERKCLQLPGLPTCTLFVWNALFFYLRGDMKKWKLLLLSVSFHSLWTSAVGNFVGSVIKPRNPETKETMVANLHPFRLKFTLLYLRGDAQAVAGMLTQFFICIFFFFSKITLFWPCFALFLDVSSLQHWSLLFKPVKISFIFVRTFITSAGVFLFIIVFY